MRERHVTQLASGEQSRIQAGFEYSDGMGSVVVKKIQAEPTAPGQPMRWIASGKTILNNKGKPVKQYEPYFSSSGNRYEEPQEEGVTSIIYYDAAGRTVRTELPDGSYSRVEFSPWHVTAYDQNDTVLEPGNTWFSRHTAATASAEEKRAAQLAAEHADTPASTFLDSLGREVISVAHNRWKDGQGTLHDEKSVTFTKLDAEGKPLWIRDARGNLVMQYLTPPVPNNQATDPVTDFVPCYDIAGNLLFQHSMDAGDRWMLNDAAGQPLVGWDSRGFIRRMTYDALRRPTGLFVTENGTERLAERTMYGEAQGVANNHRARVFQVFDGAGVVTSVAYDFKGNLLQSRRELLPEYKSAVDWQQNPTPSDGTFTSSTSYDALNRPVTVTSPDGSVYRPGFNEANLLDKIHVQLRGAVTATPFVTNIDYNAKGQREFIAYGNGVRTTYEYDPKTFRLARLRTRRGAERLQDLFYTYDPVGNITHIRDDAQQTLYFNGQVVEPHNDYTYDALYRLIAATGREHIGQTMNDDPQLKPHYDSNDSTRIGLTHPQDGQAMRNYTERYEYDAVGNILKWMHAANGGSWTREHGIATDSNRLLQTTLPGNTSANYDYDAHGNMITMPHLPLMQWDYKDQLQAASRQVVNNGTPETTYYTYDASGQRVRKVTEGQAPAGETPTRWKERIYLGGFEVYRKYDPSTDSGQAVTLERETLHVMDDQQRIAMVETRTAGDDGSSAQLVRYQVSNHLGSASLELDGQAKIISYEEYTPYGSSSYQAVRSQTETPKRYRCAGKERDEETGLYYHSARYYAPWIGRWSNADPLGLADGVNIYYYVRGNPVSKVDPQGTQSHPGDERVNEGGASAGVSDTSDQSGSGPGDDPNSEDGGETSAATRHILFGGLMILAGLSIILTAGTTTPVIVLLGGTMSLASGTAEVGIGVVESLTSPSEEFQEEVNQTVDVMTSFGSSPSGLVVGVGVVAAGEDIETATNVAQFAGVIEGVHKFKGDPTKIYALIPKPDPKSGATIAALSDSHWYELARLKGRVGEEALAIKLQEEMDHTIIAREAPYRIQGTDIELRADTLSVGPTTDTGVHLYVGEGKNGPYADFTAGQRAGFPLIEAGTPIILLDDVRAIESGLPIGEPLRAQLFFWRFDISVTSGGRF